MVEETPNYFGFAKDSSGDFNFIKIIKENPDYIQFIKHPERELELQLIAVSNNGNCIRYIQNPLEEVQKAAIENNPLSILLIKSPTLSVIELALSKEPDLRNYLSTKSKRTNTSHLAKNEIEYLKLKFDI